MAMFILTLGMVAVASIFPVAGLLQRRSQEDILTRQVKDSVAAMIVARGVSPSHVSANGRVEALKSGWTGGTDGWSLGMRCYPAHIDLGTPPDGDPNENSVEDSDFNNRAFYWVPLGRTINVSTGKYAVYVFILRRQIGVSYPTGGTLANGEDPEEIPKVVKLGASATGSNKQISTNHGNTIYPGDMVLGDNGTVYQITAVSGNTLTTNGDTEGIAAIWYGRPAKANAPAVTTRIFALGSEAVH